MVADGAQWSGVAVVQRPADKNIAADRTFRQNTYQKRYIVMAREKRIRVVFYANANGLEPVREWLKNQSLDNKRIIGNELKTVEYGWPIGMPVCRNMRW